MDEKLKFIARYLEGEKMAPLCREFGITRPTGYKLIERYKMMGQCALVEQKRTPNRYANKLPIAVEALILDLKREYSNWGAPKIREKIIKKYPDVKTPAISTIHAVLDRNGLVKHRLGRKRFKATGTPLNHVTEPNQLWCADYKGEFMLGNKQYCYPLTITDYASRYLLTCEALASTREEFAFEIFTRAFKEFGLPDSMRTDNGVPFASGQSFYNLTKLSVWWLRLGINVERITPGHPEQNGRHERMHLTLKLETTRPPRQTLVSQQEKFERSAIEFDGTKTLLNPRDKNNWVEPDTTVRVPSETWGQTESQRKDPKMDNPWIWSHRLAEDLSKGIAQREHAEQHLRNLLNPVSENLAKAPQPPEVILKLKRKKDCKQLF